MTEESIEKTHRRLKRRGVKFSVPPKKEEWGWHCMVRDPDGNELWITPTDM